MDASRCGVRSGHYGVAWGYELPPPLRFATPKDPHDGVTAAIDSAYHVFCERPPLREVSAPGGSVRMRARSSRSPRSTPRGGTVDHVGGGDDQVIVDDEARADRATLTGGRVDADAHVRTREYTSAKSDETAIVGDELAVPLG